MEFVFFKKKNNNNKSRKYHDLHKFYLKTMEF